MHARWNVVAQAAERSRWSDPVQGFALSFSLSLFILQALRLTSCWKSTNGNVVGWCKEISPTPTLRRSFSPLRRRMFKRSYGTTWTLQFRKRKLIRESGVARGSKANPRLHGFPLHLPGNLFSFAPFVRGSTRFGVGEVPLGKHTEPFPSRLLLFATRIATQAANTSIVPTNFFPRTRRTHRRQAVTRWACAKNSRVRVFGSSYFSPFLITRSPVDGVPFISRLFLFPSLPDEKYWLYRETHGPFLSLPFLLFLSFFLRPPSNIATLRRQTWSLLRNPPPTSGFRISRGRNPNTILPDIFSWMIGGPTFDQTQASLRNYLRNTSVYASFHPRYS